MSVPGHAVQILNLVDDSMHPTREGRLLKLNTQALRDITGEVDKEGHELAVIAIAGLECQGKSFIMTYVVRYLQALEKSANGSVGDWMERDDLDIPTKELGFPFRNSFERTTEGIWMWSRPFIIPRPDNPLKTIAVLLMDTDGCYGTSLSNQEHAAFFGLSLLTSSVFIYNETSRVSDNTLAMVGKFMEYGQLASQTFQAKMFQRVIFLVRDWNSPSLFEYGAAGGQGFVRTLFEPKPKMSKEAVGYRRAIMTNFEDCNAYLMPHPGEQVISDQFKGSVGEMKPEFQQHVQGFVENLMDDIVPKKVSGHVINGAECANLFNAYVTAFNSSEMPSPASIIKTALFIAFDAEIRRLTETFEMDLRERLDEVEGFVASDQLLKMKKKVEADVVRLFEEKKHACSPGAKALYIQKLKSELDQTYLRINEENESNRGRFLEENGNGIIEKFRDYLSASVQSSQQYWKKVEFDSAVIPEQERLIQRLRETCSGMPAQYVEVQVAEVAEKTNNMKDMLWLDLTQKRKLAEQRGEAILQEVLAEYVSTVAVLMDGELQTDIKLDRLLQKQIKFAMDNFQRRMESEFKDPAFITEFIDQLEANLAAELQNTNAINSAKWDEIKSEFETEITETVNAFSEEVEIMFGDISTADVDVLTGIYKKITDLGVETLEEITCPSNDLRKQYIQMLKEELQKTFDDAVNTLENCVEARILRCQLAESSSRNIEQELQKWIGVAETVTFDVLDSESPLMMENELARCEGSMNSVSDEHKSPLNDTEQIMKDGRTEVDAANKHDAEVTNLFVMQQLKEQSLRDKEELKQDFDESRNTLTNSKAKMLRCQQIAESSSQKFEDELRNWIRATGTVTSRIFDCESRLMMENELAKCQDSMNSVHAEYESYLNNAKQMMEDRRMELAAANKQKAEEVNRLVTRQLQEIRHSYDSAFEDVKSEIRNTSDLQKFHGDVSTRLTEQLRQLFHQASAQSLFSTYESSVAKEMNEILDLKRKDFEATAEGVKNLRSHVIPDHEEEFRAKIMESIRRNPFLSDEVFGQILKDRCSEVINCLFKQISLVVPLESTDGTALMKDVEVSIEQVKQHLIHELRDIRQGAEEAVKKVYQRILGFAMNEISSVAESLIIQGAAADVTDAFEGIRSVVVSKFESEWPYDASSRKDEIKLRLLKKIDDEVDEALLKVQAKVNKETQIVGAAMKFTLSSYAQSIAEALESGKYITMKKLQQQLTNGLFESQKSFDSALKNRNLSYRKYKGELKEKLSEKKLGLLQTNRENLEKLLEETTGFISEKYTGNASFKSPMELAEFKRRIEEEVIKLVEAKCEGDCEDELRNQVHQKVNGHHSMFVATKEAEVNANVNFHVHNAVRYYSDNMTESLGPILPQHPTILRSWHDRSKVQALQKLKRAHVFVTDLLEKQVDQALEQVYRAWEDKNKLKGGEDKNLAIGIDLGTTTCCVAIHRLRETQVIKDRSGRNLTPSFLFIGDDGSSMVGHEAKDQAHIHPEDTVFDAKRLIGRKFNDPCVQKDMKTWPFKVIEDTATGEPRIVIKRKHYRPEEVLAQQLRHMKLIAEEDLHEPGNIKKAVITVPANFNDRQRDATRQAAQIADLDVLQIINEPTAAAMAYAVQWKGIEKTVLVFDFGGGTLDVTILRTGEDKEPSAEVADPISIPCTSRELQEAPKQEVETGTESSNVRLHVLTTLGDTHLGGEDFDSNLVNFCVKKFEESEGVKLLEVDKPRAHLAVKRRLRRLRNECEKIKVCLTSSESATANLDTIYGELDLQVIVTKKQFEEMNEELFQKAIAVVADALASAKLDKEDIDEVLMVGGSSRIPRMRELLQKFFGKENLHLNQRVDIQEAVAKGAAIQACIINGVSSVKGLPRVTDVQPFSLGIEVRGEKVSVIIPRNTKIPVRTTQQYWTTADNQTEVRIIIYSGENEVANSPENIRLGEFVLNGIPRGKKGKQRVDVTMEIDGSGILNVTAVCASTGGEKNLIIKSDRGRMSDAQIVKARKKLSLSGKTE